MNLELILVLNTILNHDQEHKWGICRKVGGTKCAAISTCDNCPLSVRLFKQNPDGNIVTQLTKVMERIS